MVKMNEKKKKQLNKFEKELKEINQDIKIYRKLPNSERRTVNLRRIWGQYSYVKQAIRKLKGSSEIVETSKSEKASLANSVRSGKMRSYWSYMKAIKENYYPNMTVKQIR